MTCSHLKCSEDSQQQQAFTSITGEGRQTWLFEHHFSIRTMLASSLINDTFSHHSSGLSPYSSFCMPMMELTLNRTPCLACKVTQATSSSSTNFSLWTPSGSWKKKFPRKTARTVRSSAIARAWPVSRAAAERVPAAIDAAAIACWGCIWIGCRQAAHCLLH